MQLGFMGPRARRRRGPRRLAAAGAAILAVVGLAGGAAMSVPARPASAQIPMTGPLRTAYYFGNDNPVNVWSGDVSGARKAFERMQADGFNAVGLALPWGDFQTRLTPPTENKTAFHRLDKLVSLAASLGMRVVLRLNYEYDVDPNDQLPWNERHQAAYANQAVYQAWLDYISALSTNLAPYHNIASAYLSWEDFWDPINDATAATTLAQQANESGFLNYSTWVCSYYGQQTVDAWYGQPYSCPYGVPTPPRDTPAFMFMFSYDDWMLMNRFFYPAQNLFHPNSTFPGLSLEARIESDVLLNGSQPVGWYSHSQTFHLTGSPDSGLYYDPYIDDPSSDHNETWQEAEQSLANVLYQVGGQSGGLPLYIHEFEFVSNAPAVAAAQQLPPSQVGPFLVNAAPLLAQATQGYGLWTYRNFTISPMYNPSFAFGTTGWHPKGTTKAVTASDGSSSLAMSPGSSVSQILQPTHMVVGWPATVTVSFQATATTSGPLRVRFGNNSPEQVTVGTKWHQYALSFPSSQVFSGRLTISDPSHSINVTRVQAYTFTQAGDVYNTVGTPQFARSALRQLNQSLATGG